MSTGKLEVPDGQAQSTGNTNLSVNIGFDNTNTPSLLYIPVQFDQMRVAALIDTGSSICVLSKDLYNQLPERFKLSFEQVNQDIRLANNSTVEVFGLAKILVQVPQGKREIDVYILPFTSHPLILGTGFLRDNNIVLDFSDNTFNVKSARVQSHKRLSQIPKC